MKKILPILFFIFFSNFAYSQDVSPPICDCFDYLATALEEEDKKGNLVEEDQFIEVFNTLKITNPNFEKCAGYYSLSFNVWTKGKFRILSQSGCKMSEKTLELIEKGPIIYEMNFKLEKEIEKFHEDDVYELVSDTTILNNLEKQAEKFLWASYGNDGKLITPFYTTEYLSVYGKEKIDEMAKMQFAALQEMNIKVQKIEVIELDSLLRQDSVLSTQLEVNISVSKDEEVLEQKTLLLAISLNKGENWYFFNRTNDQLLSLSFLMNYINPYFLEKKLADEKGRKLNINTIEELADYFCDCMNNLSPTDFFGGECMKTAQNHELWKVKENKDLMKKYLKKNCKEHAGNMIFRF
ncbi:hypothetical protein ACE193_22525 [Bernardetia sp. OM2101]|uniref:hypothetical protein n=1 Tax=Bernardetia sp. OM2101 TaxID=3344876 RepID=UPI0035CFB537